MIKDDRSSTGKRENGMTGEDVFWAKGIIHATVKDKCENGS